MENKSQIFSSSAPLRKRAVGGVFGTRLDKGLWAVLTSASHDAIYTAKLQT